MDYKTLLNERQYEAVTSDKQYVRVVAGAGSGKTRVLTHRLSYLIGEMGVDPWSIVAIAFTNKVASEMKNRAVSLLKDNYAGLQVSTFHSFCAKFLRMEIYNIDFPSNFTILDDEDTETLIKQIGVSKGYKRNDEVVKGAMAYISNNKCLGKYPSDITLNKYCSENEKVMLEIFTEYETKKDAMLSLDFDDLLLKTIQILQQFPKVREKWQNRISNILVDEFQDTNDVQFYLIKLLMNDCTSLYVVGDPDQTIYTWRGANQKFILDFEESFPGAETIVLDRNYRSTKPILDSANKLIAHNKKRVPKNLYTTNESTEQVHGQVFNAANGEAKFVLEEIQKLHNKGVPYKDMVILYRAAYLTLPFEKEFMAKRLPYEVYGGLKFFQRKEIKDALAYFKLLRNPKDDISFERIANIPRRGLGEAALAALKAEKGSLGLSYLEYLREIEKHETSVKSRIVGLLLQMVEKMDNALKSLSENLEAYSEVLKQYIEDIGYFEYLKLEPDTEEERHKNLLALFGNIVDFLKEYPNSTFDDYLENAALQSAQDEVSDKDVVRMMTIHVAKGLEFDYVFVVGVNDGIFPSDRTITESGSDGTEEERRLCYVALTRAKKKLYVTCNFGYSYVLGTYAIPSPFLMEAGLRVNRSFGYYGGEYQKPLYSSGYYKHEESDGYTNQLSPVEEEPKTNGINDWKAGDKVIHDAFGKGVVINIIDETILQINFEEHGMKSIMANHPKLHRDEKGAEA